MLVYQIVDGNTRIMMTILFNWARVDLLRDRLVIFFDERDVVLYYGITRQRAAAAPAAGGEQAAPEQKDDAESAQHEGQHPGEENVEPERMDPAPAPAATEYVVVEGDSLSKIAKAHYGDPAKYTLILDANPALRENPNRLRAGQILRIPSD
jgi:nucleoid-associated protein YgaU